MDTNIPDYKKIALINQYQEQIESLKEKKVHLQEELAQIKNSLEQRLKSEYSRVEGEIKKSKDSTKTASELDTFRSEEKAEYTKTVAHISSAVDSYLQSQEYYDFVKDFIQKLSDTVIKIEAPEAVTKGLNVDTEKSKNIIVHTDAIEYDLSPHSIRREIIYTLLVNS